MTQTATHTATDKAVKKIPGWLTRLDRELIRTFLAASASVSGPGDLAEIGVYMGKSAALIGDGLRDGETFTVLDLFGRGVGDDANAAENAEQYPHLTRERFERHYLTVHDRLPSIITAASDTFPTHVRPGSLRFIHIDGSHLYEHVANDVDSARKTLKPDGIVVFDDIRTEHTPGVSAAVWHAVRSGLHPIVLSPNKFYGTWGDPRPYLDHVRQWVADDRFFSEIQIIDDNEVLRVRNHFPWYARAYLRIERWRHSR